ncbi:MAG: sugar phosphate isomerase/epimerase family protein [Opitutales bacterium]
MNTPKPISIQLYTLREQVKEQGFPQILEKVATFGYTAVEFAGFGGHSAEEAAGFLKEFGLKASSIHGGLPTEDNLEEALANAERFGYQTHIGGFGREHFQEPAKLDEVVGWVQKAVALLEGKGLRVGLHNHEFEFDKLWDGKLPHERLRDEVPGVFFQLDTYWVETGMKLLGPEAGRTLLTILEAFGERVKNPHIKDGPCVRGEPMTAVGKGSMDWKAVFAAMPETVEWLVVELDHCATDMLEAVEESYKFLTGEGYATGNR